MTFFFYKRKQCLLGYSGLRDGQKDCAHSTELELLANRKPRHHKASSEIQIENLVLPRAAVLLQVLAESTLPKPAGVGLRRTYSVLMGTDPQDDQRNASSSAGGDSVSLLQGETRLTQDRPWGPGEAAHPPARPERGFSRKLTPPLAWDRRLKIRQGSESGFPPTCGVNLYETESGDETYPRGKSEKCNSIQKCTRKKKIPHPKSHTASQQEMD